MPSRRVFITVAEVSGDKHAAQLVRSLKSLDPSLEIEGYGGPEMAAAGVRLHRETVSRAAMGWRGALRFFEVYSLLRRTRAYFKAHSPDLLIGVDSPSMNFHFAKAAHECGIPVLQYVAPQLWAWQEWRMKKVRRWIDRLACILPFEEEYFRQHGVAATFVGHPLFDELPANHARRESPRFERQAPVIGIIPGSRKSEVVANFKHLLEVAKRIRVEFPGARFLVPTTHATNATVVNILQREPRTGSVLIHFSDEMPDARGIFTVKQDAFDQFIPQCDLCLCKSGTSTLHVAAFEVPMIVVYRTNPVLWHLFGRWLVRTRTYSLVNLLSGAPGHIVPEFIPWYGSNQPVAAYALDLLRNPQKLEAQRERLGQILHSLDKPGASMNVARMAMEMMNAGASAAAEAESPARH